MELTQVLLKPLLTEKTTELKESSHRIAFLVHPKANKLEIQKAVESTFNVKVNAVNVVKVAARDRVRQGKTVGTKPGYKKAYVALDGDVSLDYFEGV